MGNFLSEILSHKYEEVRRQTHTEPFSTLQARLAGLPTTLDFAAALRCPRLPGEVALIAEVKKASPSKGLLCPDFDPARLAAAYAKAGAAALSVLTDAHYFMGDLAYLEVAKAAAGGTLPVLRKDFLIDPYQIYQARVYGADAVLLIMAALDDEQAALLFATTRQLGMDALVEVHSEAELARALQLGARIIGVNNRDLHSFAVDLEITARLAKGLPRHWDGLLVSESGIATASDIARLHANGAQAVLIGESLVRAASTPQGLDPARIEQKVKELFPND